MPDPITEAANKAAEDLMRAKEEYLRAAFGGNIELIRMFKDDFVLEAYPVQTTTTQNPFDNTTTLIFRQDYRIRRKTPEERSQE